MKTKHIKINSSNIRSVGYNPSTQDLIVGFDSGVYVYSRVLPFAVTGLLFSESSGKYLNSDIKPNHQFEKISADDERHPEHKAVPV